MEPVRASTLGRILPFYIEEDISHFVASKLGHLTISKAKKHSDGNYYLLGREGEFDLQIEVFNCAEQFQRIIEILIHFFYADRVETPDLFNSTFGSNETDPSSSILHLITKTDTAKIIRNNREYQFNSRYHFVNFLQTVTLILPTVSGLDLHQCQYLHIVLGEVASDSKELKTLIDEDLEKHAYLNSPLLSKWTAILHFDTIIYDMKSFITCNRDFFRVCHFMKEQTTLHRLDLNSA